MARPSILICAAGAIVLAGVGARAQDFHTAVTFGPGVPTPGTITAYRNLPTGGLYTPYPGQVLAGRFTFSVTDPVLPASVPPVLGRNFFGYCVDISNLDASPTTFKSATLIDGAATSGTL